MNASVSIVDARPQGFDRIGMILSIACGVHCIAAPVVAASAGALSVLADEGVELAMVSVAVTIAAVSIGFGVRRHRTLWPLGCLAAGVAALIGARAVEEAEVPFSVVASALLVLAHGTNLRALRRWRPCC